VPAVDAEADDPSLKEGDRPPIGRIRRGLCILEQIEIGVTFGAPRADRIVG